jgi:hypothetical protein
MDNQIRISYFGDLSLIIKPNERDFISFGELYFNQEELNELINLAVVVQNSKIQYDLNIEFYMIRGE